MAESKCRECVNVEKLRNDYEIAAKKYSLPGFEKLAEEFDIERMDRESSFVLRDIRRAINEKISAYMHLFETFINPASAPMFVFTMLKNVSEADRKEFGEIYKSLARFEVRVFKLDTIYSEKDEAEFIKKAVAEWDTLKKKIFNLIEKMGAGSENNTASGSRGYFG